ncbi:unnamed protein product [Cochlearia groenlandica]
MRSLASHISFCYESQSAELCGLAPQGMGKTYFYVLQLLSLRVSRITSISSITSMTKPTMIRGVETIIFVTRTNVDALPDYCLGWALRSSVNVADGSKLRRTCDAFTLGYPHGLGRGWGMFTFGLRGHLLGSAMYQIHTKKTRSKMSQGECVSIVESVVDEMVTEDILRKRENMASWKRRDDVNISRKLWSCFLDD